jgi:fucose permease
MEAYVGGKHEVGDVAIARRRSQKRGRRVLVGAFGVMFVMFGITNSFSPFFGSLQETFTAQRGAIALIFSIAAPLYFLLGLVSGPLADSLGPRRACQLCARSISP